MSKVIDCPAKTNKKGVCICDIKCSSSYYSDGSRKKVRKSLPYQGIARRFLAGESIEEIINDIKYTKI